MKSDQLHWIALQWPDNPGEVSVTCSLTWRQSTDRLNISHNGIVESEEHMAGQDSNDNQNPLMFPKLIMRRPTRINFTNLESGDGSHFLFLLHIRRPGVLRTELGHDRAGGVGLCQNGVSPRLTTISFEMFSHCNWSYRIMQFNWCYSAEKEI